MWPFVAWKSVKPQIQKFLMMSRWAGGHIIRHSLFVFLLSFHYQHSGMTDLSVIFSTLLFKSLPISSSSPIWNRILKGYQWFSDHWIQSYLLFLTFMPYHKDYPLLRPSLQICPPTFLIAHPLFPLMSFLSAFLL